MLEKLVNKIKFITLIFTCVLFVLWTVYLFFGKGEDKIMFLVLTPCLPAVVYGFIRLTFKVVSINASVKYLNFITWFFLIMGTLGIIIDLIYFINRFPDALSPSIGACMGLVLGVLTEAKKNIENNAAK